MKILIIKLGALGDIIISTSVVNKIIAHHKKDEVYLLTTPSFTNIFNTIKSLKVVPIKRHGFFNLVRTILWIRKCGFKTEENFSGMWSKVTCRKLYLKKLVNKFQGFFPCLF